MREAHLTRIEQANLIAGHAVGYATAYLDGRHTAQQLADNAHRVWLDLLVVGAALPSEFHMTLQMLIMNMTQVSKICSAPGVDQGRADRWHDILGSYAEFVMDESRKLCEGRT